MERCSEFIRNKALFGSYPTQEHVDMFESIGVRYFIDLTCIGEKHIIPYTTIYTRINYAIVDQRVPTNWKSFAQFIVDLSNIIKSLETGEKVYLHCKGGHGRSGVVVASLLCYLYKMSPSDAISKTTQYHGRRKDMREKWRKLGSPQTRSQKHFVTKFFEPLYIYNNYTTYFSADFCNDAEFPVLIPGFGLFPTATSAFNAFRDPDNNRYVGSLEAASNIDQIYKISSECKERPDWSDVMESVMYIVVKHKLDQHKTVRNNLLDTGLRPIIVISDDSFWGKMNGVGKNMLGKLFGKLRKEFYMKMER